MLGASLWGGAAVIGKARCHWPLVSSIIVMALDSKRGSTPERPTLFGSQGSGACRRGIIAPNKSNFLHPIKPDRGYAPLPWCELPSVVCLDHEAF